jgi:AraC-like DNA-binding protein
MREHVGLAPRDFRRIVRVQDAIRRLRGAPARRLGRIALEAGYFDHAHFCREFRRTTGVSPSAFLARERPLTEAFLEEPLARAPQAEDPAAPS